MTAIAQKYFAGLSRTTFLLAFASLFSDISTEMLYPVLPVFLTQTLGATGSIVGLVDGFAQAAQNIVQGLSGTLSDRLQRRKPVALAGYFLAAISKPLMGLATVWQVVFGARLLDRLGAGARSAPRDALIAASVAEAHRGRAFGLEGVGDNAGAFLGPLVTLLLLYALHFDIRSVFYLAVVPGLLAFALVVLVKEPRAAVAAEAKIDVSPRQFPPAYWKYLLVIALFALGNSSNAFLILRTQDIGASLEHTILIYAAFNLVAALISYPAGSLTDRWGGRNVLFAAFAIFLIGLSRLCVDAERRADRRPVRVLRPVPGHLSHRRQGARIELRVRPPARQRHRLVQHHGWPAAACRQRRRRPVMGPRRACGRVLLRRLLCRGRHGGAGVADPGAAGHGGTLVTGASQMTQPNLRRRHPP